MLAMTNELCAAFSQLSPNGKAMFLARVAHNTTVDARVAYIDDYEHPDGVALRKFNEFVHRVTGYTMHVLDQSEMPGQDESVVRMIFEFYGAGHEAREKELLNWAQAAEPDEH
jgi:hypothetical protein